MDQRFDAAWTDPVVVVAAGAGLLVRGPAGQANVRGLPMGHAGRAGPPRGLARRTPACCAALQQRWGGDGRPHSLLLAAAEFPVDGVSGIPGGQLARRSPWGPRGRHTRRACVDDVGLRLPAETRPLACSTTDDLQPAHPFKIAAAQDRLPAAVPVARPQRSPHQALQTVDQLLVPAQGRLVLRGHLARLLTSDRSPCVPRGRRPSRPTGRKGL